MHLPILKKYLSELYQDTLLKLLTELARYKKENMDLLEARLLGKSGNLENCKKAVRSAYSTNSKIQICRLLNP